MSRKIGVGIIGTGWIGEIRAKTCATHPLVESALDRPVLVTPEQARQVMEVTLAADLSAERNAPVTLPLE